MNCVVYVNANLKTTLRHLLNATYRIEICLSPITSLYLPLSLSFSLNKSISRRYAVCFSVKYTSEIQKKKDDTQLRMEFLRNMYQES